jgi:uncharacterized protein YjaG (DUF416 family)
MELYHCLRHNILPFQNHYNHYNHYPALTLYDELKKQKLKYQEALNQGVTFINLKPIHLRIKELEQQQQIAVFKTLD